MMKSMTRMRVRCDSACFLSMMVTQINSPQDSELHISGCERDHPSQWCRTKSRFKGKTDTEHKRCSSLLFTNLSKRVLRVSPGNLRPISLTYLNQLLELVLNLLVSLSQPHTGASVEDISSALADGHEVSRAVSTQVMSWFGDIHQGKWKMDVDCVIREVGLGILRNHKVILPLHRIGEMMPSEVLRVARTRCRGYFCCKMEVSRRRLLWACGFAAFACCELLWHLYWLSSAFIVTTGKLSCFHGARQTIFDILPCILVTHRPSCTLFTSFPDSSPMERRRNFAFPVWYCHQ